MKVCQEAIECSWNDRNKTKYYLVIFDQLQGHSRGLIQASEQCTRGPLTLQLQRRKEIDYSFSPEKLKDYHQQKKGYQKEFCFLDFLFFFEHFDNRSHIDSGNNRRESRLLFYSHTGIEGGKSKAIPYVYHGSVCIIAVEEVLNVSIETCFLQTDRQKKIIEKEKMS